MAFDQYLFPDSWAFDWKFPQKSNAPQMPDPTPLRLT